MTKIFIFYFLLIITFSSNVSAYVKSQTNWQESFYTDDTHYFLKLTEQGFTQRFRIHKDTCNEIESAYVILKNPINTDLFRFRLMTPDQLKKWPDLYGVDEKQFCWWQVEVNGLNLNAPIHNHYALKFTERNSGDVYYFNDAQDSILPKNKLSKTPVIQYWISLGAPGATPVEGGGVFFKIWEPMASAVHLFLNDESQMQPMIPDGLTGDRASFVFYSTQAKVGDKYIYKFVKNGKYENLEVANNGFFSESKIDPMARELTYSDKGGKHNGYIDPWAIVSAPISFEWKNDSEIKTEINDNNNLIIYQLWPLTFNPKVKNGKYVPGNFKDVAEKIPYLNDLGINAVEFLPLNETRFDASWGYALDSLLLIEKNYGTNADFKLLVDQLHQKKIKVITDIVLNHINNSLIRDPLTDKIETSKFYKGNTGWGPKPRFESAMVRKWLTDSMLLNMRDFHLDGFRFDMIEHVWNSGPIAYKFMQEINQLLKMENPDFYSSAEQLPDNVWVTYPKEQNGLGFDSQWSDRFKNCFEVEFDHYRGQNRALNLEPLKSALLGYSNHPDNTGGSYSFGGPSRTLNYLGSHDFIGNRDPLIRIISGFVSYEWEDDNHFFRVRPLEEKENKEGKFRLIHNQFTHGVARAAYGALFTKPGSVLFFQGEELAQDLNIENEWSYLDAKKGNTTPSKNIDLNRYIASHRFPWEYLELSNDGPLKFLALEEKELFRGHLQFFKELIKFKKEFPEMSLQDARNVQITHDGKVMSYLIGTSLKEYFVTLNFGYNYNSTWVNFPEGPNHWWEEIFNSSNQKYGGTTDRYSNIISNLGGRINRVRLAGPSIVIFAKKNSPKLKREVYLRSNLNDWSALRSQMLMPADEKGELYMAEVNVDNDGLYEFKLATEDWQIELGLASAGKTYLLDEPPYALGGYLGYEPELPNVTVQLPRGKYKFMFNLKSFKFNFIKIP
jgi:1,4-alpha-glucan branching enzyme